MTWMYVQAVRTRNASISRTLFQAENNLSRPITADELLRVDLAMRCARWSRDDRTIVWCLPNQEAFRERTDRPFQECSTLVSPFWQKISVTLQSYCICSCYLLCVKNCFDCTECKSFSSSFGRSCGTRRLCGVCTAISSNKDSVVLERSVCKTLCWFLEK